MVVKIRVVLFPALVAIALSATVTTVHGAPIPSNPGDFIVAIQPGGPTAGEMPECNPELTSIGGLFMAGQTTVVARCSMSSTSSSALVTGTASNPTLAEKTGDSGFTSGTINADCTASQSVDIQMTITMSGATMDSFSGEVFQACTFVMQFADALSSRLSGTIELNGLLGDDDGAVVNNTVTISISAKVFVTSGTGAFAGYAGSGTFSQSQEINIDPNNQGAGGGPPIVQSFVTADRCAGQGSDECDEALVRKLAASNENTMTLNLVKSAGVARILAPAPPAGAPKGVAKVKATTKVEVTAPAGSVCVVKANTGRVIGRGKVAGKFSVTTISPRDRSYMGATSIISTCTTRAGKVLATNRVRIKL